MDGSQDAPAFVQDQPIEADGAPSTGEATSVDNGFDAPFNINDVDESVRPHVERYQKQLQSAFTAKTQELAEQRKQAEQAQQLVQALQGPDDNLRAQALAALGLELDDVEDVDDEPFLDDDPMEALQRKIAQLEGQLSEHQQGFQQQQQMAALEQHVDREFKDLSQKAGRDLTEREQRLILATATSAFPPDQSGMPNVKAAFEDLFGLQNEWQNEWLKSKRSPSLPPVGQAGTQKIDLSDPEQRQKYMASILEANAE